MACIVFEAGVLATLAGSLQQAIESYAQRTINNADSMGFLARIAVESQYLSVPTMVASLVYAVRGRFYWQTLASLALLVLALPWFVIINGRAEAILVPWVVIIALAAMTAWRPPSWLIALSVPFCSIAAVFGFALRIAAQLHFSLLVAMSLASTTIVKTTSDALPMLDASFVGVEYVRVAGHNLFNTLFAALVVLIPRQFWPSKPIFAPQLFDEALLHSDIAGLPAGIIGEGYVALGWWGALLLCGVLGMATSWADRVIFYGKLPDLRKLWFIFAASVAVLMGIRVGTHGVIVSAQIALLFLPIVWLVERFVYNGRRMAREQERPTL
jgi:hypothetical protein